MKQFSALELLDLYETLTEDQQEFISNQLRTQAEINATKDRPRQARAKNPDHQVHGRIVFEFNEENDEPIPIHNLYVELWDRDTTNPDDFLGHGLTDKNGNFEIWYDPSDAGLNDLPDLDLRLYELRHKFDKQGNIINRRKLIYTITGEDNVKRQSYDFGTCRVPFWEYAPDSISPRVLISDEGNSPESYGPGRALVMVKVLSGIELKKRRHILEAKMGDGFISLDRIQNDYPKNLTRILEEQKPGSTRSDEFFGDMMLNGMASAVMDKDPANPERLWIHYHWNSYEQDGIYAMPNIDIYLQPKGNSVVPVEIIVWLREPGVTQANAPLTKHKVTPADGPKWEQAKRIARVSATLSAELSNHLAQTHLNGEQYAVAARRNFRLNPIRQLLFPHVKEVSLINHSANTLLLGESGYITRATGFTAESINQYLHQVVATLDWKGWKPRRKICPDHKFAEASQLYWDVLGKYLNWFFETYDEDIRKHWYEVKRFSDTLIHKSTDFFLCSYLRGHVEPIETEDYWFDWNERMKLSIPRTEVNGVPKSVSAITDSEVADDDGIENIKQVCRYVIHHTTFMHWWSNSKQYDEGGELKFNALGLRYGNNGIFSDESDESVLPPPEDATMQLWISYMLSNTNFGFILKNEEKDIHPRFIEFLKEHRAEFEALGVDITKIPSRTNI